MHTTTYFGHQFHIDISCLHSTNLRRQHHKGNFQVKIYFARTSQLPTLDDLPSCSSHWILRKWLMKRSARLQYFQAHAPMLSMYVWNTLKILQLSMTLHQESSTKRWVGWSRPAASWLQVSLIPWQFLNSLCCVISFSRSTTIGTKLLDGHILPSVYCR